MRLGIVLDKSEVVATADVPYPIRIGATAVEVDYHHGTGAGRNGLLYLAIVYLERLDVRLYQDGAQSVFGNGQNRGYVGIGRHDDLVALLHGTHFLIGSEDERQGIESVGTTHTMTSADVGSIVFLKLSGSLSLEIPAPTEHTTDGLPYLLLVKRIDPLQVHILYHSVHS